MVKREQKEIISRCSSLYALALTLLLCSPRASRGRGVLYKVVCWLQSPRSRGQWSQRSRWDWRGWAPPPGLEELGGLS